MTERTTTAPGKRIPGTGAEEQRIIDLGRPECHPPFADNSIKTSRFTLLSFFPLAIRDQFRRNGNIYFLCIGILMFLGTYTSLLSTSVSPWTTLGPLALVMSVSLMQEAYTDLKRHRSDNTTNYHPCVVLQRSENNETDRGRKKKAKRDPRLNDGRDLKVWVAGDEFPIAFESVFRKNIRSGDLVIVRNREMIPADLILLASANEGGNAYIETSSIDGETNLKLRNSPHIPVNYGEPASDYSNSSLFNGKLVDENEQTDSESHRAESLKQAVQRVVNMSLLGHPDGVSALANPANADEGQIFERNASSKRKGLRFLFGNGAQDEDTCRRSIPNLGGSTTYIATLTSEPPNTHVNNYSGKLTFPPNSEGARSVHAPLNVENILLRGAVLRNTEWVIGLACFTGADTKLVMNSVATPSKFSQMDVLINRTVFLVVFIMILCVCSLGAIAVYVNQKSFHQLWYAGYTTDSSELWPYFNLVKSSGIGKPEWDTRTDTFIQKTVMFITLLSNFVPLALYVSVEMITMMMTMYVGWDLDMYHKESDTPAVARSSIVTDLGLVKYIFSDKTGTLTCNIMKFKRCSVDGHIFGMPVAKAAPKLDGNPKHQGIDKDEFSDTVYPLKHLLADSGISSCESSIPRALAGLEDKLTFNAEMFLRVMSICHTVVVEKDHVVLLQVDESNKMGAKPRARLKTGGSKDSSGISWKSKKQNEKKKKEKDGAPSGCAYQAESPDEGALVSVASTQYGFQFLGRNSSGAQISCPCPSLLENKDIVKGLKDGSISAKVLAAKIASSEGAALKYSRSEVKTVDDGVTPRIETWPILAINKFDSDRKRMSVLVRSPPELGSIPMLLCKGADSSMLIEEVCGGTRMLDSIVDKNVKGPKVKPKSEADDSELDSLLGLQAHLGEFASEGLRTLVLGVRILSDEGAEKWLAKYKKASTSIENRDKELTAVAGEIEQELHIVGATAIEDKLQDGVPETISNLEKAGIKLWVLTGDKRETAIEIGYSTKVLTSKMHLTEVVDGPPENVKVLVAMEFMRHIKIGNLPDYQLFALDEKKGISFKSMLNCLTLLGDLRRKMWLAWRLIYLTRMKRLVLSKASFVDYMEDLSEEIEAAKRKTDPRVQRRKVRELAQSIIKNFLTDSKRSHIRDKCDQNDDLSIVSDDPPVVFERAKSARETLQIRRDSKGKMTDFSRVQKLALTKLSTSNRDGFNEESFSMQSYRPSEETTNFDKRKRTLFEKLFAVDNDVRNGKLTKHLRNEYKDALSLDEEEQTGKREIESMVGTLSPRPKKNNHFNASSVKRGLVVEGAALKHLLGDPILEEMLFAVASCSDSVIACRVSPIQKALLLKMVRKYVSPTPTTLAIGDGANDVGMIQEAHIGVGISGLEGQQAVNSSDFAIAQFRFLEPLLLIHGRWNFMRMSKAILFFFYKNTALVGILMIFTGQCLYSGTMLFDPWVTSVFNFVGGTVPIIFMAIFDRDLPRDYVLRNPEVYASSQRNEFLSLRMTLRWVALTVIHAATVYFLSAPILQLGGGISSGYLGLMGNWGRYVPGDGEGGDLQVFGTTIYSQLIYAVTFKALLETRSLLWGKFPTFTCKRGKGEGWMSRAAYTWIGMSWFSILLYILFLYVYGFIGRNGPQVGTFFNFAYASIHVLNTRSITWMVSILIPAIAIVFDMVGKVYGNMFFPTQTQIHMEIAAELNDRK
ncbi:hypothetical protein ACHAXA_002117 [Cyclostephanos tholiformis]|uniref:P-type phospholipid transporter n=1 Tax=Cyclostephanos tholiformis TaxID=382380 RepID=A0ABD3R5W9_9STRA